jgi:hypothetical protein
MFEYIKNPKTTMRSPRRLLFKNSLLYVVQKVLNTGSSSFITHLRTIANIAVVAGKKPRITKPSRVKTIQRMFTYINLISHSETLNIPFIKPSIRLPPSCKNTLGTKN